LLIIVKRASKKFHLGKEYPHRPYADGGMVKKGFEKSELPCSRHGFTLANLMPRKKPPLVSPATKTSEGIIKPGRASDRNPAEGHRVLNNIAGVVFVNSKNHHF
jgi:hypothetical protein